MIGAKTKELDRIALPQAPEVLGLYTPVSEANGLVYLSGMLPLRDGKMLFTGKVKSKLHGHEAAQLATLNAFAVLKKHYVTLTRIRKVVQASVYIAADADFEDHAYVADGCSELLDGFFSKAIRVSCSGSIRCPKMRWSSLG